MNRITKNSDVGLRFTPRRSSLVRYASQALLGATVAVAASQLVQQSPSASMSHAKRSGVAATRRAGHTDHGRGFVEQVGYRVDDVRENPALAIQPDGAASSESELARERIRKLLGEWEDDYQGKRYLTLREDGTAIMVVLPNGIGKRIFAARLEFDINWTFVDEILTLDMHGGRPENKVRMIQRMFGRVGEFRVQSVSDSEMLVSDLKDNSKYVWRRSASGGIAESTETTDSLNEKSTDETTAAAVATERTGIVPDHPPRD